MNFKLLSTDVMKNNRIKLSYILQYRSGFYVHLNWGNTYPSRSVIRGHLSGGSLIPEGHLSLGVTNLRDHLPLGSRILRLPIPEVSYYGGSLNPMIPAASYSPLQRNRSRAKNQLANFIPRLCCINHRPRLHVTVLAGTTT